jgi:hypothetical protein
VQPHFQKASQILFLAVIFCSKIQAAKIEKGTIEIGGNLNGYYATDALGEQLQLGLSPTLGYYFTDLLFFEGNLISSYNWRSNGFSYLNIGMGGAFGAYFHLTEKFVLAIPVGMSIFRPYELTSSPNTVAYFHTQYHFFVRPTLKYGISDHVILGNSLTIGSVYGNYRGDALSYDRFFILYGLSWSYIW